ncbi:MAG: hypothetical protein JWP69_1292 [Flaviaesturariibacter sp.]|nr:hypothetical protein [Flaviaesturariibacter sp.]
MNALTVHPLTEAQENALKIVFEAMGLSYEEEPLVDATDHLMSTEANRNALNKSMKQAEEGKVTSVKIEDLWK